MTLCRDLLEVGQGFLVLKHAAQLKSGMLQPWLPVAVQDLHTLLTVCTLTRHRSNMTHHGAAAAELYSRGSFVEMVSGLLLFLCRDGRGSG